MADGNSRGSMALDVYRASVALRSLEEFRAFKRDNPAYFSDHCEATTLAHVKLHGIETRFLGRIAPEFVHVGGRDPREDLVTLGLNSRMRVLLEEVHDFLLERDISDEDVKIYGHEALTLLARRFRGRFPRFIGTEYCRTEQERRAIFPVCHGDVMQSEFPDESFDLVQSAEVLEHVPSIDRALRDSARILRAGGRMIATLPIHWDSHEGFVLAEEIDGETRFHVEPVYHGNPMDSVGASLVYEVPGWNLLDRAKEAGFKDAYFRFVCDQDRGIIQNGHDPVCARLSAENFPRKTTLPYYDPPHSTPKGIFVAIFDRA